MSVDGDRSERIKQQLSWHKQIGQDVNIPAGFHAFRKAKAWVTMVKAVRRHQHGISHQKLPGMPHVYQTFNTQQSPQNRRKSTKMLIPLRVLKLNWILTAAIMRMATMLIWGAMTMANVTVPT
jgi:hypothetical protein